MLKQLEDDPFSFHPLDKATSWLGSKLPEPSLEMSGARSGESAELQSLGGTWTVRAGQALTGPPALFSWLSNTDVICNPREIHQQVNEAGKKEGNTAAIADFQSPVMNRLQHIRAGDEKRPLWNTPRA